MKTAAGFLLALLLSAPTYARSLVTTTDGGQILGDIEEEQLDFTTDSTGQTILPCVALDRLRALPDATMEATLKDGKTLVGALRTEITITDGLIKRRLQPGHIRDIAFDIFVRLKGRAEAVCPIRAEIELPADLVLGKLKTWRSSATRLASCDENRLNSVAISRQRNVLQTYVRAGEKPRKGTDLTITPSVILAPGEDQYIHLTFILMQGDNALSQVAHQFEGDEGEVNDLAPVHLWVPADDVDPSGPPMALRFQVLTRERGTDEKAGPVFLWFVKLRL